MNDQSDRRCVSRRDRPFHAPPAWGVWWHQRAAERTDRALAAREAGLDPDRLAAAFGAPAARLARVAGILAAPADDRSRPSELSSPPRPGPDFVTRLQDEVLVAYDRRIAAGAVFRTANGKRAKVGRRPAAAPNPGDLRRAAGRWSGARRSAASLAIAASVAVALFARIDSASIRGIDTAATAVAATRTVTVTSGGTPIAFGTEVPAVLSADG